MVAKLQITPMKTTISDSHMALNDRKNNNRITADKISDAKMNNRISLVMRSVSSVRICGKPLL